MFKKIVLILFIALFLLCSCKSKDDIKTTDAISSQNDKNYEFTNSEKQRILEDVNAKYQENDLELELVDIKGEKGNCMIVTRFSLNNQYIYQLWYYQDENNIILKSDDKKYTEIFLNNKFIYVKHEILETILLRYDLENNAEEKEMEGGNLNISQSPDRKYLCIFEGNNVKILNSQETLFNKNFYNNKDNKNIKGFLKNNCIWSDDSKKLFIVFSDNEISTVHILNIDDFSFETYCYNDGNFIKESYVLNANNGYVLYNNQKIRVDNKLRESYDMFVYLVNIYTGDTYEVDNLSIDGYGNKNIFVDDDTIEGRDGDGNVTFKYKIDKKFLKDKFLYQAKVNHNKCIIYIKNLNTSSVKYNFDYIKYLYKDKLSQEVLIKGIEENTGWNYDIKSIDNSEENKIKVCIGKNSTLFTKKINKNVDGYYTEDHVLLADLMLDSIVKTFKNDSINYSEEKLAKLKIYFCTENDKPITIPAIGVEIPTEYSYKGLYALQYDEGSKEDEGTLLVRQKIEEEVSKEAGIAVKSKEIFKLQNSYYAVVEIPGLVISYDSEYENINKEYSENKYKENSYELWKYSSGNCKRVLYNSFEIKVEDYKNYNGGSYIYIKSDYTDYIIKYKEENENKILLYECKFSDYIESPNKEYTCFLNNNESVAIINKNNEKIIDVFTDSVYKNKLWFPSIINVSSFWWNNDSKRYYFTLGDAFISLYQIDLETLELNDFGEIQCSMDGYMLNKDKEYIVYSTDVFRYDMDSHIEYINSKKGLELNFINLKTKERYNIDKRLDGKFNAKRIGDSIVEYNDPYNYNSRITYDLSDKIDDKKIKIRKNIIPFILENYNNEQYYTNKNLLLLDTYKIDNMYYQLIEVKVDKNSKTYELWRFLGNGYEKIMSNMDMVIPLNKENNLYLYYENSTDNKLLKISKDNIITAYEGKISSLSLSPNKKYISLYNTDGNIAVLDEDDNILIKDNIFTDLLEKNKLSSLEIGVSVWSGNSCNLIMMIKNTKNEKLAGIKLVDTNNKAVKSVEQFIDCLYNKIYLSMEKGFVLYATNREFSNEGLGNISDNIHLILENLYTGEKIEIAKSSYEYFNFYVKENVIEYYTGNGTKFYIIEESFFE